MKKSTKKLSLSKQTLQHVTGGSGPLTSPVMTCRLSLQGVGTCYDSCRCRT